MRDIVATIQPEQDVIVRSDLASSVCVQGAPGTGKTAVGLHRAAYLLYSHRDQLSRQGVLVVGPNASFLRYIGDVLPALGEIDAQQTTIEEPGRRTLARLNARYAVRGADDAAVATLKGDARLAEVAAPGAVVAASGRPPRGCWCRAARDAGGSRRTRWRRSSPSCAAAGSGTAPPAGCSRSGWRTGILVKMEIAGDSPDDRVQDAVARSRAVKRLRRPGVAGGRPGPAGAAAARRRRASSPSVADGRARRGRAGAARAGTSRAERPASARWSLADAVLVDEAADLVERTPSLGHVVADEAQDLSPMMLRAVGRRCSTGSHDRARRPGPGHHAVGDPVVGGGAGATSASPDAHVEQLTQGFRVPGEVIEYAARLLPAHRPRPGAAHVGAPHPRGARPSRAVRHRAAAAGRRRSACRARARSA